MAIIYTWRVVNTSFTLKPDGMPDRITSAHWRCDGKEGELSFGVYGQSSIDLDASTATEQDTLAAVKAANPDVESGIAAQFTQEAAPAQGSGLPWENQFPVWKAGVAYVTDNTVNYKGEAYTCIQAHTSQVDWIPPLVPALFQRVVEPGTPNWVAGVAYQINDTAIYEGVSYDCIQAHTSQVGWEPPNEPSLWTLAN